MESWIYWNLAEKYIEAAFPLARASRHRSSSLLVGNCNVGVVLTTKQYESGYYTDREAILIASCFSATSLPFCLVIAAIMGVDQYLSNYTLFSVWLEPCPL